jgi:hypothetical protein
MRRKGSSAISGGGGDSVYIRDRRKDNRLLGVGIVYISVIAGKRIVCYVVVVVG